MASEALQLALALYRAPAQRHALRGMRLPDDIGTVIQLASAPQPLLSETAAQTGEVESTIVEAARFYLQQTLFQPDASAYRVLGLGKDAAQERIREHYRWLQRWLHPDRRGEDWEALLTSRVNWAWGQLRNETVRATYDLDRQPDAAGVSVNERAIEARPPVDWRETIGTQDRGSYAKWIAFGTLLCGCIGLSYVALIRDDSVPVEELDIAVAGKAARSTPANAHVEPSVDESTRARAADARSTPSLPAAVKPAAPVHSVEGLAAAVPTQPSSTQPAEASAAPAAETTASVPPRGENELARKRVDLENAGVVSARASPAKPATVVSMSLLPPAPTAADESLPRPAAPVHPPNVDIASVTPREKVSATVSAQHAEENDSMSRAATGAQATSETLTTAPTSDTQPPVIAPPAAPVSDRRGVRLRPKIVVDSSERAAASIPPQAGEQAVKEAASASSPSNAASLAASEAIVQEHGAGSAPPPAERGVSTTTADALERFNLARERVGELSAFLGDTSRRPPPVWNDAQSQTSAEYQRNAMFARAKLRGSGNFTVAEPNWRMSDDAASLDAAYQLHNGRTMSESGRFLLNMTWREKMWLVTRVELEPAL